MTVGEALLSPTRTYAPVVIRALAEIGAGVHGLVHCTGGGQTKCLRLGTKVRFVKDAIFEPPPVFRLIQAVGGLGWDEMAQVFNLGHRMELFVDVAAAGEVIAIAADLGVEARVVGRCEEWTGGPRLHIAGPDGPLAFGHASA
jgi:phosphoribosylformylglycinamidine cyclo-ligase